MDLKESAAEVSARRPDAGAVGSDVAQRARGGALVEKGERERGAVGGGDGRQVGPDEHGRVGNDGIDAGGDRVDERLRERARVGAADDGAVRRAKVPEVAEALAGQAADVGRRDEPGAAIGGGVDAHRRRGCVELVHDELTDGKLGDVVVERRAAAVEAVRVDAQQDDGVLWRACEHLVDFRLQRWWRRRRRVVGVV